MAMPMAAHLWSINDGKEVIAYIQNLAIEDERERIIKAVINNSTQLADLYKLGLVAKAEVLLATLIRGEQK